ncbi:hypothetical protein [Cryptosporangium phraense]|nr:hypothetical protein [Cryptosporangium phraense]
MPDHRGPATGGPLVSVSGGAFGAAGAVTTLTCALTDRAVGLAQLIEAVR